MTQLTKLTDRRVIQISGEEAHSFLQGLVTCDMDAIEPGQPGMGALLTPQGKILFDFHIHASDNKNANDQRFLIDCRADFTDDLIKRLTFYKLRAKVEIEDLSDTHTVIAMWGHTPNASFPQDPRLPALGWRFIIGTESNLQSLTGGPYDEASLDDYHAHRIALGVPEGGVDFAFGDAFPHEANMDQLKGVSFHKGCYVGQEVVSRMENRGTARTRTMIAASNASFPPAGTEIKAGGKTLGTVGSSANGNAVAIVRVDRVAAANANNDEISAGPAILELTKPDWAAFSVPEPN